LQERKSARTAKIEIVDLNDKRGVVHFDVAATLNDIACFVRDRRCAEFPEKSFSIVVNGKAVFPESSFTSVSLLKARVTSKW
jgi:hypothetical protein